MVNERPDQHRSFIGRDEIDEVFSHASRNSKRIGCPPREVLEALARRARPIGDPGYVHLAECSACYQAFREIQTHAIAASRVPSRGRWQMVAAALIVIAVVGMVWLALVRPRGDLGSGPESPHVSAELDLRPFATPRSDQPPVEGRPLSLPAGVVAITVLLPVGSEPGAYDVELRDTTGKSYAATSGVAEVPNYVTTLHATIDLRAVSTGVYQLAIRRQGDTWRVFPARVQ